MTRSSRCRIAKVVLAVALLAWVVPETRVQAQSGTFFNQRDDRYRLLGLKRAKEAFETARAELERQQQLFGEGQVSQRELDLSRSAFADAEVNYQQSLLAVLFEQQFVSVVGAVKSRAADGSKRVRIRVATTSGASAELRKLLAIDDRLFRSLQPDVVTNVYVSLLNDSGAIIGQPYEAKIDELRFGTPRELTFTLLQDLDEVVVNLIYGNGSSRTLKILLQKDAGEDRVAVQSQQFSQEVELGGTASFDLTLESFTRATDTFAIEVVNLPEQISRTVREPASGARLSQVRFTEGATTRRAVLDVSLPDRATDEVPMDQSIPFYLVVAPRLEEGGPDVNWRRPWTDAELELLGVGFVKLELTPRGVGRLLVRAPMLFHSVAPGEQVEVRLDIVNEGTRRLDNVEVRLDAPPGWERHAEPALLPMLEVNEEKPVHAVISPAEGVAPGRYEVRVRTSGLSNNQPVISEDKSITVEIRPVSNVLVSVLLMALILGLLAGMVVLGIRLSRR